MHRSKGTILIIDDEQATMDSFELTLASEGMEDILCCRDSRKALDILHESDADVVLLDLVMPHISGEELLPRIRERHPDTEVIVITGIDCVDSAVECMRCGAFDYLVKPVENRRLAATVSRALEMRHLRRENSSLRSSFLGDEPKHPEVFAHMITQDTKMLRIFKYIEAIADSPQPLLITGESGTGKELIARAAHALGTPAGPFTAINVAGLDDTVFSDTLFGHTKGAFTGAQKTRRGLIESASGGTLFLDEIGDLSPASQVKLLRLIQEREYLPLGADVPKPVTARVVAATHKDLDAARRAGTFRDDLYFRLCIHHIHLPPLRERCGDLPLLIDHFIHKAASTFGRSIPSIPVGLVNALVGYPFPGNIRELESLILDAFSHPDSENLSLSVIRKRIASTGSDGAALTDTPASLSFPEQLPTLSAMTDLLIDEALRRAGGKQTIASALLGISQPALSKRLKRRAKTQPEKSPEFHGETV